MQIVSSIAVPAAVFFLMFVVGLGLTPADFRRMAQHPRTTVAGTVGPLVLLPLGAAVIIVSLGPTEPITAGLILVATAPGAPISNMLVYLGRGNTALSVTLTALSNTIGILTYPLLAAIGFALFLGDKVGIVIPASTMIEQLVLLMLVPITIGMVVRHLRSDFAQRHRAFLKRISLVVIAGVIVFIIISNRTLIVTHLPTAMGIAGLLVVGGMLMGLALGRIIGAPFPDCLAILIEFSLRNTAIAIVVAVTTLRHLEYALFIVAYFVVEMTVILGVVAVARSRRRNEARSQDAW